MGLSQSTLERHLDQLAATDADLERALSAVGYPPTRHRPPGFATLFQVIVSQQVSTHAASAIWQKCQAAFGEAPSADAIQSASAETLRACGLSVRKCEYAADLAAHFVDGRLSDASIARLDDEQAIAALTAVRGIGRWTAEIYLLFAEGREDVWPADDLAIQVAFQRVKGLEARPRGKPFYALSEPWSPRRGAAAILMWSVYGSATLDG
ncbi:MAG: DNA-3-methyladenine glycosylase 2 family protein [Pseudomonadota bacterium]